MELLSVKERRNERVNVTALVCINPEEKHNAQNVGVFTRIHFSPYFEDLWILSFNQMNKSWWN